ncbi:glycoside hydrolase superfamily [Hygrophoropsis aurantiaca]|uniref:Glycoside hydrolase superfamily n=1 Tax=Hygrophoropsis aurantiaca TaxID=72124 RepID=A0ACB8AP45_9AGAM|nr:glycoside hydrolase superfamily [Hygrophoropsis aurantiaca]
MITNVTAFNLLLQTLNLTQGFYKPTPKLYATMSNFSSSSESEFGPVRDLTNGILSPHRGFVSVHSGPTTRPFAGQDLRDPSCTIDPYDPPPILNQTFAPFNPLKATIYRYRQQQSVNLGSWFVQENWMVPSLFTCASGPQAAEFDVASGWGSSENARRVLERHWDTFINQTDFDYLASIGINTVRLPVGYWTFGPSYCVDTPFAPFSDIYQNSWPRVLRAINMASQSGIGVLLDLHGAVGSQNGQSHSGVSDGNTNLFNNPDNINKTLAVLTVAMQTLGYVNNVVGIQILNEPQNVPELPDFYAKAITTMRQVSPIANSFPLYIHDGFDIDRFSDFIANRTDFIVEDHHSYFVFTPSDDSEPASQHKGDVDGPIASSLLAASNKARRNLVIDEWSCALTDKSLSTQKDPARARKDFCMGQMDVYANISAGWGFWAYTKEDCSDDPGWCFKTAVGQSLPATFFSFGQALPTNDDQLQFLYSSVANMTAPIGSFILSKAHNSSMDIKNDSAANDFYGEESLRGNSQNSTDLTPEQKSVIKGYSDGFMTVKIFAQTGWSKLGFSGQYIEDSLNAHGSAIVMPGTEDRYRQAFKLGLGDGEDIIHSIFQNCS